jgi:hypothetical protein
MSSTPLPTSSTFISTRSGLDSFLLLPNVNPDWQQALNDISPIGQSFVVSAVDRGISGQRVNTKMLIFRDSSDNLDGLYLIYVADSLYDIQTQGQYTPSTFTGFAIYTDVNGRFKSGYKIATGQILHKVKAFRSDGRTSTITPRGDCYAPVTFSLPIDDPCGCFMSFSENTDCGQVNMFGDYGSNSTGGSWSGSQPPAIYSQSQLELLAKKYRDNGLEEVWLGYLNVNHTLLQSTEFFLNRRGGFNGRNKTMLLNLIPSSTNLTMLAEYFELLALNDDFFYANLAENFPLSAVLALERYRIAGFSGDEFAQLYSDQTLFQQADEFFNQQGFSDENKLAVKGFTFLIDLDDDFKSLNQNRGSKTIKQLLEEFGYPKLGAGTLIALARRNGVDVDQFPQNFTRLGRIMEDFVLRSIGIPKNNRQFLDPLQFRSAVIPDGLGDGNVAQYKIDQNGISRFHSWVGDNSIFFDSKFTAKNEKMIKDNASTNANGTPREQLSTMIDVLARMKGGSIDNIINNNIKPSDHGIASLYIITLHDVEIDPNLIQQAQDNNVNVFKRWIVHDSNTNKISVSDGYQDKTPLISTRKQPGSSAPLLAPSFVDVNWDIY